MRLISATADAQCLATAMSLLRESDAGAGRVSGVGGDALTDGRGLLAGRDRVFGLEFVHEFRDGDNLVDSVGVGAGNDRGSGTACAGRSRPPS